MDSRARHIAFKCKLPGCQARVSIAERDLLVDNNGALLQPVFTMCPVCGWFQAMEAEKGVPDLRKGFAPDLGDR